MSLIMKTILLLTGLTLTLALSINSTLDSIQAGIEFDLKITNDLYRGSISDDSAYDVYRVYLVTEPVPNTDPSGMVQPTCYLEDSVPIATTDVKINIPPNVGPSAKYKLALRPFKSPPQDTVSLPLVVSSHFNLTGATGTWSASELNDNSLGGFDSGDHIPCTSLSCARDCAQNFKLGSGNDACAMESTYECVATCPGVTKVAWGWYSSMPSCSVTATGYGVTTAVVDAQTVMEFWTTSGTPTARATAVASSTASATGTGTAKPNAAVAVGVDWKQAFVVSVAGILAFGLGSAVL